MFASTLTFIALSLATAGDPSAAAALASRGEALFAAGDYAHASEAYRHAYELDPSPAFLFAQARSEQEAGRCEVAIGLYGEFIATDPPSADVDLANMHVGRCVGQARAPATAPPRAIPAIAARPVGPVPRPTPEVPAADRAPRRQWQRDPVGGGLLGAGLAVLATGAGLMIGADARAGRAASASTTGGYRNAIDGAKTLQAVGIAGVAVGSVLLTGAIVRYVLVARSLRRGR